MKAKLVQKSLLLVFSLAPFTLLATSSRVASPKEASIKVSKTTGGSVINTDQSVDIVVTVLSTKGINEINVLSSRGFLPNASYVFSQSERENLRGLGNNHIGYSVRARLNSIAKFEQLKSFVKTQKFDLAIEYNRVLSLAAGGAAGPAAESADKPLNEQDRFFGIQWALKNSGQTFGIELDDMKSYPVKAIAGEDIGVFRAPKENLDPSKQVVVAVLDTGLDYGHPDITNRIAEKPEECRQLVAYTKCLKDAESKPEDGKKNSSSAGAGASSGNQATVAAKKKACDAQYSTVDSDHNGYPLDCAGWNLTVKPTMPGALVWGNNDASDNTSTTTGHGTHVAGIIAAESNNGVGIQGAAQSARILPVKVISASPSEPVRPRSLSDSGATLPSPNEKDLKAPRFFLGDLVARGILYALRSNAQIINMSLGWPANLDSPLMKQMIQLAEQRNVLIVAAAGNDNTDALVRPCIYPGVICVASHDPDGAISHFSNYGSGVDIAAPGLSILSTIPLEATPEVFLTSRGYDYKHGTSMASPYVAGVLARLLNAGFSPREAYARIMSSARETKQSERLNRFKFVNSGNIDLARAFTVKKQPLLLPTFKTPIAIAWDRIAKRISFSVSMKNFWAEARNANIELSLLGRAQNDARILNANWVVPLWKEDEIRNFDSSLEVLSNQLESELTFEMKITLADGSVQTRRLQAEVRVPIGANNLDPEIKSIPILSNGDLSKATIRSVLNKDGSTSPEYFAIESQGESASLKLLKLQGGSFTVTAQTQLATKDLQDLLLIEKLSLSTNQQRTYVLIYRTSIPADADKATKTGQGQTETEMQPTVGFRFFYFDEDLKPKNVRFDGKMDSSFVYPNKVTGLKEDFEWMGTSTGKVPLWVDRGTTPDLEKKPYDPWAAMDLDAPIYKVFYWSTDGLKTIAAPKNYVPLALLKPSPQQIISGRLPIMFVKDANSTNAVYSVAEAFDGKLENQQNFNAGFFRALWGISRTSVSDISQADDVSGTVFFNSSYRTAQRATALLNHRSATKDDQKLLDVSQDFEIAASGLIDSIINVPGLFIGRNSAAVMAQSIYDLEYQDLKTRERATTSMRKFSFLPQFFYSRLFSPASIDDSLKSHGSDRLPGMYVASGLGLTQGLEVIVPRYNQSGQLLGLVRPARLQLDASSDCESVGNAVGANADEPARMMFFCKDRFIQVPLKY